MAKTVELDEETKSKLDDLRMTIRRRTGKTVTERELLAQLIDDAYESRGGVVGSFRESTVPLSEAEKEAMRRGWFSSGVGIDEDDIDEDLYG